VFSLFKLFPSSLEIRLVFDRYDVDKDGKLSFNEFADCFTPKDENYKVMCVERLPYNTGENFVRAECFMPET